MNAGRYVYAVAPAAVAGHDLGTGIDGRAVETVPVDAGLAAVVHRHGDRPYRAEDGDVERRVLEHAGVVDRVWEAGPVLPVSFNVIVAPGEDAPAEQRLRHWLGEHATDLAHQLDRLRGRAELRVEIALDPQAVADTDPRAATARQELATRPAGVQRLLRKRQQQHDQQLAEQLADELYPDYRRRLAGVSEDLAEPASPRGEPGTVSVLAASLLVPADGVSAVGQVLSTIQDEQPAARIRFLGPWPTYSFADLEGITVAPGSG